jgi:hypothetical protein
MQKTQWRQDHSAAMEANGYIHPNIPHDRGGRRSDEEVMTLTYLVFKCQCPFQTSHALVFLGFPTPCINSS